MQSPILPLIHSCTHSLAHKQATLMQWGLSYRERRKKRWIEYWRHGKVRAAAWKMWTDFVALSKWNKKAEFKAYHHFTGRMEQYYMNKWRDYVDVARKGKELAKQREHKAVWRTWSNWKWIHRAYYIVAQFRRETLLLHSMAGWKRYYKEHKSERIMLTIAQSHFSSLTATSFFKRWARLWADNKRFKRNLILAMG